MFATARPPHAQPFGEVESGAVRRAHQLSLVDQELAGDVVQAAPLVGAAVEPGLRRGSISIEDDLRVFAVDIVV